MEPTSKLDALRVLEDLGAELVSYKTIDRNVRKIHAGGHRDVIAEKCFTYASDCGGLSLLLYDVTTLYFEADNEDGLRKVGYSKERRIDPQIVIELLVDGPDSRWKSAATQAIPQRRPPSCRSSPASCNATTWATPRW